MFFWVGVWGLISVKASDWPGKAELSEWNCTVFIPAKEKKCWQAKWMKVWDRHSADSSHTIQASVWLCFWNSHIYWWFCWLSDASVQSCISSVGRLKTQLGSNHGTSMLSEIRSCCGMQGAHQWVNCSNFPLLQALNRARLFMYIKLYLKTEIVFCLLFLQWSSWLLCI